VAGTNADVDTPGWMLALLGLGFAVYGGVILRWWRAFARFGRRWTPWPEDMLDSMYGSDVTPRRGFVSSIGAFFTIMGLAMVVIGLVRL
jgi:hypothetical protein